ncbi:MAG TPA: protein kinase [Candidatus Deferrimicrobium sp.]|nr:protein kinase [Candidatus Deferrimicrobium sp.]
MAPLQSGTCLSHYRIIRQLGAGGMGEVYLADDTSLNRQVAIKLLSATHASDYEFRKRFSREAQAAAALNHPNIVTIHGVGEQDGRPYIVMEFVEGATLRECIPPEGLPSDQVVDIAAQICEGLAEAHRVGFVHRDVKPANIKLDTGGRVRILDFGLARRGQWDQLTRPGTTVGTVSYMSPEQILGKEVGPASDLFSLGVVLYQMITGRPPFSGEYEASILYAIVNDQPRPLAELRADISPRIAGIVARLLQKDVEQRYQSAGDVLHDLREPTLPISERLPVAEKSRRKIPYRRYVVPFALSAILLIVTWLTVFRGGDRTSAEKSVLAVLPFENIGPPEDAYFADGMTDAVTMRLAKVGDLAVISRASSGQYKGSQKSLRDIGAELGATYMLAGTIRWDKTTRDNKIMISASLVRVEDDTYLWAETYDRVLVRVFDLQSDIARDVTRAMKLAIGKAEMRALQMEPTQNLAAYDFYLRGNEYFNRSWERRDIESAMQLYERAVELDSQFAAAYAMLSRGHSSMYWEYFDRSEQRREAAREAAEIALQLQPGLVEGHMALGYYYYHCHLDYVKALAEFDLALQDESSNSDLYNAIAAVKRRQGDLTGAAEFFTRALELDPRSHLKAFDVGLTLGLTRQYAEADQYLDRAILLAPDWPLPHIYKAWLPIFRSGDTTTARQVLAAAPDRADLVSSKYYWWLARLIETDYKKVMTQTTPGTDTVAFYLHKAQLHRLMNNHRREAAYADSARVIIEVLIQQRPDDARLHSYLGLAYAGLRQKENAIAHGMQAVQLLPTTREAFDAPFWVINLAETLVIFDEYDAAIDQLRLLLSIPGFVSVPYLKLDPLWAPLHGQPAFEALLQSVI